VSDAEAQDPALAGRPIAGTGAPAPSEGLDDTMLSDEELAPELEPVDTRGGRWRNRRGRERERRPGSGGGQPGAGRLDDAGVGSGSDRPSPPPRPSPAPSYRPQPSYVPLDYRGLDGLAAALPPPLATERPRFLGTGTFGGPWSRD